MLKYDLGEKVEFHYGIGQKTAVGIWTQKKRQRYLRRYRIPIG